LRPNSLRDQIELWDRYIAYPFQSLNPSIVAAGRPRSSPDISSFARCGLDRSFTDQSSGVDFAARHEVAGDSRQDRRKPCGWPCRRDRGEERPQDAPHPRRLPSAVTTRGNSGAPTILVVRKTSSLRVGETKKSPATRAGPGSRLSSSLRSRATSLAGLIALRGRVVVAAGAALRRLVGLVHVW
jgi:hypothetical protein